MHIRSISFFADPGSSLDSLAGAARQARVALDAAGHVLQTVRLATTPFPLWLEDSAQVDDLVSWCGAAGVDYLALGPVRLDDDVVHLDRLPDLIAAHDMLFASAEIADTSGRIDVGRAWRVAALVQKLAKVRPDGFSNLYFTATANCPPGSPFFPVSYHDQSDSRICFAYAAEAAHLAVDAFRDAESLEAARANLVSAIEREAATLVEVATLLVDQYGLAFGGIDFSLAPFPEVDRSLGTALEALGVKAVGGHGSLFAAAFIAECVNRARFPRCGFSGLMFPVLEDAALARRVAEGHLTINDLLLFSAVCGAGLDTVPLPGDVGTEELAGILLDLAALAVRLDKPLTARLMPLPGLEAGDHVTFDFPYFADTRVMVTKGVGLAGILAGGERLELGRLLNGNRGDDGATNP